MWPGAWAPSISVSTPRARACAHNSPSGKISAVVEVMWLAKISRVRGVTSASTRCAKRARSRGSAISTFRYTAPASSQTRCQVASQAPYSWSVDRISSPGRRFNDRATTFTPVEALGTKTRSAACAPR